MAHLDAVFFDIDDTLCATTAFAQRARRNAVHAMVAAGLRASEDVVYAELELLRIVSTRTQTKKGRLERWANVKQAFQLAHPEMLRDAHVLLVDDVVTTGATIEACALALADVPGLRLSVFTCACA